MRFVPSLLLVLSLIAVLGAGCAVLLAPPEPTPTNVPATREPTRAPSTLTSIPTQSAGRPTATRDSFPTIRQDQLPPEARTTIGLIQNGGPFPYRQDGVVFENREGILPARQTGYYHEYTVITPGSPDRGARRIITGKDGEMYYTADHYGSFKRIVP